jgi:hypothetical protein
MTKSLMFHFETQLLLLKRLFEMLLKGIKANNSDHSMRFQPEK